MGPIGSEIVATTFFVAQNSMSCSYSSADSLRIHDLGMRLCRLFVDKDVSNSILPNICTQS